MGTPESPNKKFQFNIEEEVPPQTINIPNGIISPISENSSSLLISRIEKLCRYIKWSCIPLSLMQLLFILPRAFPLIVTIVSPIFGFVAAYKYYEFLTKLFAIYSILLIFIQVLTMIILRGTAYIVVQSFFIIFEIVVAIISFKVSILMGKLSNQDWVALQAS